MGAVVMSAAARPLDSVREQFKAGLPEVPVELSRHDPQAAGRDYYRGYYRDRYRSASTDGLWGHLGSRCGASVLVKSSLGKLVVMPVLCDRWSCPLCGSRRAAWLKRQIQIAIDQDGLTEFWTLTIKAPKPADSRCWSCPLFQAVDRVRMIASHHRIKAAWNSIRTVLRQRHGKFQFIWVNESTKRGYGHLHLVTDLQTSASELSGLLLAATGDSFIAYAEPIEGDKAAGYLAKYCCQQTARPTGLERSRAFSKSRGLSFERFRGEASAPDEWVRVGRPYWDIVGRLELVEGCTRSWSAGTPMAEFRDLLGLHAGGCPEVLVSYDEYLPADGP